LTQVTGELPVLTGNLVKLLESKRRLSLLPQIAESFQSMLDEHNNIAHAQVLTAVSLDEDERNALTSRLSELTGKEVQVEIHEAPEILGGLVARIGDRLIDGSARTKLLALKRQLARATR
jgi:F-type H+-transporting ATPase subunit delta